MRYPRSSIKLIRPFIGTGDGECFLCKGPEVYSYQLTAIVNRDEVEEAVEWFTIRKLTACSKKHGQSFLCVNGCTKHELDLRKLLKLVEENNGELTQAILDQVTQTQGS